MTFSKNMWLTTAPVLQTNRIEQKLKNRIRNVIYWKITPIFTNLYYIDRDNLTYIIWDKFWFKINEIPTTLIGFSRFIDNNVFNTRFYIYDFIEIIYNFFHNNDSFKMEINQILTEENSAFQLIDSWDIVPITDDIEIECIEEALQVPFGNVRAHIKTAIQHFKEDAKDYRNSIKESISAVEAMCCEITWDKKATLWESLKKLNDSWIDIHPALEKWFELIYWYTNNGSWIRHKLNIDSQNITFNDAKFMLVSCCAFVNYLIWKQNEIS